MDNNKNKTTGPEQTTGKNKDNSNEELDVQNPFDKSDNKKITQQDVESEQEFKEAQTERD